MINRKILIAVLAAAILVALVAAAVVARQREAGSTGQPAGDHDISFQYRGLTRTYRAYLPKGYDSDKPAALVTIPKPAAPVPFLEIHGMKDTNVNYYGGITASGLYSQRGRIDMSAAATVSFWADADGCAQAPVTENGPVSSTETYAQCRGGAQAVLISVRDAQHGWPAQIDTSRIIWDFFRYRRTG